MIGNLSNYEVAPETGCWEWKGYIDRNGYGRAYDPNRPAGTRTQWAHRVSYEYHRGPIPPGHEIDHTCVNTICINPAHLDAITRIEHVARTYHRLGVDDRQKAAAVLRGAGLTYQEIASALKYAGRSSAHGAIQKAIGKGIVNANDMPKPARLSDGEREDIRDLYALGIPQLEIAAWYGVDGSAISRICNHLDKRAARTARGLKV